MTSSLVGSEMCIRDSFTTAYARFGQGVIGPKSRKRMPWKVYNCRSTVSYTHLTLPTICSV
eukprot:85818-Prorocentrum_lima.AAC.1